MKDSPKIIGLMQALGLILYVSLFSLSANIVLPLFKMRFESTGPIIPMILFLSAFVTSALICGSIAFGYPSYLFFQGKKEVAIPIVLWNIAWLIIAFAVFVVFSVVI
jgi:hypothetical protein